MRIAVIYGQNRRSSTDHSAHAPALRPGGDVREFFLPRDFGEFCLGCCACFNSGEMDCPHHARHAPITEAMDAADVIILASPVYVYHATGAMKAFLDHYGYRWMVHSPEGAMFRKQAVCVCTAAGAGMRSALRDMADSLFFWGCARVYRCGVGVAAVNWEGVSGKKKKAVERKTAKLAAAIARRNGKVKPGLRTRAVFFAMHLLQRRGFNPRDAAHWQRQGWTGKARPWN